MELTLHHLFPLKLIFLYLFANALVCFGYFEGFHFASFIVSLSLTLCHSVNIVLRAHHMSAFALCRRNTEVKKAEGSIGNCAFF